MSHEKSQEPLCTYQKCLTCHCTECCTGKIARDQGEEAYNRFLQYLDEAEKNMDKSETKRCL